MVKRLCLASLLLFLFVFQHEGTHISKKKTGIIDVDINNHLCSRIERYFEDTVVVRNETFLKEETVWCFKIPPKCTRYTEANREVNETISLPKTRTVFECCEGYVMKNGVCSAICPYGCLHGKCTSAKVCSCEDGWKGPNCAEECDDGWYGEECKMHCSCQNGATCDKKNGFCHCPPGFTGTFCESACPPDSYGKNCENECHCKNGGVCNLMDRACECSPGYVGKYCEKQCQEGAFGIKCQNNCTCNDLATIFCSHIDGKCSCVPGWKGDACSSKCDLNTWGDMCTKKCECPPNSICDHVTGECSCQPGWHGLLCEEKCPEGYFGKDCKMKCPDCMYLPGTCHHVTGQCSCPAGSRGSNCDLECPENKYGENCIYECSCSNNSSCDLENGACTCLPGWIGENCSIPCPSGSYGYNCSSICNCTDSFTCDPSDGECLCNYPDPSVCSFHALHEIGTSEELDESESSMDILIILLVTCVLLGFFLFISLVICITKRARKCRLHLRKEESSTTNVIQENNIPSIPRYHFMNPSYDTAEDVVTLNNKSRQSISSVNDLNVKNEDKEINLKEEKFEIPDCDTASPLGKKRIEIIFGTELKKEGGNDFTCFPEIRYSRRSEASDNEKYAIVDDDASSQTNSIYADVEYKNEDHTENLHISTQN